MNSSEEGQFEQLLQDYLDGQLSRRDAQHVEQVLAERPEMMERLRQYAALNSRLADLSVSEFEGVDYDAQREEVRLQLERRALISERRPRRLRLVLTASLAAAAIVIAATGVFLLDRPSRPSQTAPGVVEMALVSPEGGSGSVSAEMLPLNGGLNEGTGARSGRRAVVVAFGGDRDASAVAFPWIE